MQMQIVDTIGEVPQSGQLMIKLLTVEMKDELFVNALIAKILSELMKADRITKNTKKDGTAD